MQPLADGYARKISYLRVSLTDRCNYRCTYCMPAEGVELLPRRDILEFEEIERLVTIFAKRGVRRVRLTGGEPTVRRGVVDLVGRLRSIEGIDELVMTSNGHLLPALAAPLAAAGLAGVNVSIDTLDAKLFRRLTRRGDLGAVVAGIGAAVAAGLRVKLNTVALRGENDNEFANLCNFAWGAGAVPRFIEWMPMSEGALYRGAELCTAAEIRNVISRHFGSELVAEDSSPARGPARYWRLADSGRRFGIISAMSEHFCASCNRVRLTSTGQLHTCLAFDDATDLRGPLRSGAEDARLERLIEAALAGKREGHEFGRGGRGAPAKHMVSIGG